ncbi:MAG: tRNA (guanosine(37)-N1)-methyltransferase TrmD [Anaerolineales bacterium]
MRVDVFTLFPEVMSPYLEASILGKARQAGALDVRLHQIREFAVDKHRMTDDLPYGGGGGMVMKPEPIFNAVEEILDLEQDRPPIILLTPQGRRFDQALARELAEQPGLALICGRYEGVDERIRQHLVTEEISIGDYVLTGGELPALVVIDAVTRLIPGVLGDEEAPSKDSHQRSLLEHPHYTRPAEFRGWEVPEVLRSGDHGKVERWRRRQALLRTQLRRPDLLAQAQLTEEEKSWLEEYQNHGQKGEPT